VAALSPLGQQMEGKVAQLDLDSPLVESADEFVPVDAGVGVEKAGVQVARALHVRWFDLRADAGDLR
jgi:hypothetical protein